MKKMLSVFAAAIGIAAFADYDPAAAAASSISDVVVRQQWPWSQNVLVTFKVSGMEATNGVDVALRVLSNGEAIEIPNDAVLGSMACVPNGEKTLEIDPTKMPKLVARKSVTDFRVEITPSLSAFDPSEPPLYMVVDLTKHNSVSYLTRGDIMSGRYGTYETTAPWITGSTVASAPDFLIWTGVTNDVYKTTKLVLRRIPAGTFMMGSPAGEPGRNTTAAREVRHQATLTRDYWIGVFEFTQKQCELACMTNSSQQKGDMRPLNTVSYNILRGKTLGAGWPANSNVDADSIIGKLRAHTGIAFDLPTESQSEYARRAGTTTGLNSGKEITVENGVCPNLSELARYLGNAGNAIATVGSYKPNAWGLYDTHGNVWEFCLDWYQENLGTEAVVDPVGPASGTNRALRGGAFNGQPRQCRSVYRAGISPKILIPTTACASSRRKSKYCEVGWFSPECNRSVTRG